LDPSTLKTVEIVATVLFGIAILHTFLVKRFEVLAHHYPEGSVGENLFHLLGEVEVVFGLWAGLFVVFVALFAGGHVAVEYLEGHLEHFEVEYTEPLFVFAIMAMAGTKPIIDLAQSAIEFLARLLPLSESLSFFIVALIFGPLLGSFITEPAAMTVTALILKRKFYDRGMSTKFMYATLGALFVNVSIGGTLTNFAAPPVLMVAVPSRWDWDMMHMLVHFGWKSALAVTLNTSIIAALFARELRSFDSKPEPSTEGGPARAPWWLVILHIAFMGGVVLTSHHATVFMGIFLFFLGIAAVTNEYQEPIKLREALLVGFFLGGLVTLGTFQKWWLQPLLSSMSDFPLYLGATGLTAITDNAALTYLGYVAGISHPDTQYALVAGAVTGGGLTVIANAPNPAGFGILKGSFGEDGISPLGLFLGALGPTAVALLCLWVLPHLTHTV